MENKSIQVPPAPVIPPPTKMTLAGKIFLTVGIIAIIAVFVVSGIKGLPYVKTVWGNVSAAAVSLSGIFKPVEKLMVTANPKSVKSGEVVTLSIDHIGRSAGALALQYECQEGARLQSGPIAVTDTIPCGTSFPIADAKDGVPVTVVYSKEGMATIPVTLTFTKQGEDKPSLTSKVSLGVTNNNGTEAATTNTAPTQTGSSVSTQTSPAQTPAASQVTPTAGEKKETVYQVSGQGASSVVANGKPDLAVKILDYGTIDKTTNVYTASTTLKSTDRIAVRFEVANVGTADSGSWYFNAVLPTYPSYIFTSESEPSLAPNDRIEFTIGFDQVEKKDGNVVVVNADPSKSINEVSEDNNIARVTIDGVVFPQ